MALRADTARHFITGATILIFSAAAITTAMKYPDRSSASDLPLTAELPAREASAAAHITPSGPASYRDDSRGAGSDIGAKLDGTVALNGGTVWPNREGSRPGNAGSAAWWASTSARLTSTSNRGGGVGSVSMPGSGYAVSGGARADKPASPPRGRARGNSRGNGGGSDNGGGSSGSPVFDDHTPPVGDLIAGGPVSLDDGVGNPGGGSLDPGGLAHSPEPASLLLMATGVIGVLGAARRRRQSQSQ